MRNTPFDHDAHCRALEAAERELEALGKHKLAAAVSKALSIHIDMQGRLATTRREIERIEKARNHLNDIANTLRQYAARPAAPWIGCDLFPEDRL